MIGTPVTNLQASKESMNNPNFKMNPYNACVANKVIDRKQFTVVWHVDDLKAFHVSFDALK